MACALGSITVDRYGKGERMIDERKLKPCPFCGAEMTVLSSSQTEAFIFRHSGLRNCPFYRFEISWLTATTLKEARELWNRRKGQNGQKDI